MSEAQDLSHHPAPKRRADKPRESFFALFGGPIAWFVQLNAIFALASQPCFNGGERLPSIAHDWTRPVMLLLIGAATVVALIAMLISWRAYKRTENEGASDHRHGLEVGTGRSRFLALWGVYLSAGSALFTLLTVIAFLALQRCAA